MRRGPDPRRRRRPRRADPLAGFRSRFTGTEDDGGDGLLYLDGNSLGRLPRDTPAALTRVVEEQWGRGLIGSWASWIGEATRIGDVLADGVLGARPGEVLVGDSTSVNLYKLLVAAIGARPGRDVVVCTADDFPTDRYIVAGVAEAQGMTVRELPADIDEGLDPATLAAALDERVAVVVLSHVAYRSGAKADLAADHAAGPRRRGPRAVGPVALRGVGARRAGRGRGGPGRRLHLQVPQRRARDRRRSCTCAANCRTSSGRRSAAGSATATSSRWVRPTSRPPASSASGWGRRRCSPPPRSRSGRAWWPRRASAALAEKGSALTDLAIALGDEWLAPHGVALASPRDPARRGSHVTFPHPAAWQLTQALIDRGVVPDFRTPDRVRLGPAPLYTRFVDVWDGMDRFRALLEDASFERYPAERARVT